MQLDKLTTYFIVSVLMAATIVYLLVQISRLLIIKEGIIRRYSRNVFGFTLILLMALLILLEVELTYIFFWAKDRVFLTVGLMDAFVVIIIFVSLITIYRLRGRLRHKALVAKEKGELERIIRVRDVFDPTKMNSLIIDENEKLEKTVARFAELPQLRGIFLVDGRMRLKGVVTRADLLNVIKLKLGKDIGKLPLRMLTLKRTLNVKTKDIACMFSHRAHVKLGDPLERALELMIDMDLIDIPVIDDSNKIVGDLNLSVILWKLLTPLED